MDINSCREFRTPKDTAFRRDWNWDYGPQYICGKVNAVADIWAVREAGWEEGRMMETGDSFTDWSDAVL